MNNILIDTSIIIDFLRRKDKENTLFFQLLNKKQQVFCSIITHTELYSVKSIWKSKHAKDTLTTTLSTVKVLPFSEELSQQAGKIRALENIPILDAIIAATVIYHHLSLATLNRKDFEKIKGIKLFPIRIHSD